MSREGFPFFQLIFSLPLSFSIWLTPFWLFLSGLSLDPQEEGVSSLLLLFWPFLVPLSFLTFCLFFSLSILRPPSTHRLKRSWGPSGKRPSSWHHRCPLTRHTAGSLLPFLGLLPGHLDSAGECPWGVKRGRQRIVSDLGGRGSKRPQVSRGWEGSKTGRNWILSRWGLTWGLGLIIGLLAAALDLTGVVSRCVNGLGDPSGLVDGLSIIHSYRKTVVISTENRIANWQPRYWIWSVTIFSLTCTVFWKFLFFYLFGIAS